jgi:hypothetical protein
MDSPRYFRYYTEDEVREVIERLPSEMVSVLKLMEGSGCISSFVDSRGSCRSARDTSRNKLRDGLRKLPEGGTDHIWR